MHSPAAFSLFVLALLSALSPSLLLLASAAPSQQLDARQFGRPLFHVLDNAPTRFTNDPTRSVSLKLPSSSAVAAASQSAAPTAVAAESSASVIPLASSGTPEATSETPAAATTPDASLSPPSASDLPQPSSGAPLKDPVHITSGALSKLSRTEILPLMAIAATIAFAL